MTPQPQPEPITLKDVEKLVKSKLDTIQAEFKDQLRTLTRQKAEPKEEVIVSTQPHPTASDLDPILDKLQRLERQIHK